MSETSFTVYPPDGCELLNGKINFTIDRTHHINPYLLALTCFFGWPNRRYLVTGEQGDLLKGFIDYRPKKRKYLLYFLLDCLIKPLFFIPLHLIKMSIAIPLNLLKLFTEYLPLRILNKMKFLFGLACSSYGVFWSQVKTNPKATLLNSWYGIPFILLPALIVIPAYLCWFIGRSITSPITAMRHARNEALFIENKAVLTLPAQILLVSLSAFSTTCAFILFWPLLAEVLGSALFPAAISALPHFLSVVSAPVFSLIGGSAFSALLASPLLVGLGVLSAAAVLIGAPLEEKIFKPWRYQYFDRNFTVERTHNAFPTLNHSDHSKEEFDNRPKAVVGFATTHFSKTQTPLQVVSTASEMTQSQTLHRSFNPILGKS